MGDCRKGELRWLRNVFLLLSCIYPGFHRGILDDCAGSVRRKTKRQVVTIFVLFAWTLINRNIKSRFSVHPFSAETCKMTDLELRNPQKGVSKTNLLGKKGVILKVEAVKWDGMGRREGQKMWGRKSLQKGRERDIQMKGLNVEE